MPHDIGRASTRIFQPDQATATATGGAGEESQEGTAAVFIVVEIENEQIFA